LLLLLLLLLLLVLVLLSLLWLLLSSLDAIALAKPALLWFFEAAFQLHREGCGGLSATS
jgi:hypothetical protein